MDFTCCTVFVWTADKNDTLGVSAMCRVRLASVNCELRQWSIEHGDDLWHDVELNLIEAYDGDPVCWAGTPLAAAAHHSRP